MSAQDEEVQHSEEEYVPSDQDDGEPRTYFYADKCPVGSCSHQAWERARCHSFTSVDRVIANVSHHLQVSGCDDHGLSAEEADSIAAGAKIVEVEEHAASRASYRQAIGRIAAGKAQRLEKEERGKGGKGGGKKAKGCGKDRAKPNPEPNKRKRESWQGDEGAEVDDGRLDVKASFDLLTRTIGTVCQSAREIESLKEQIRGNTSRPSDSWDVAIIGSPSGSNRDEMVTIPKSVLPTICDQITRTQHAMKSAAGICAETAQRLATEIAVLQKTKDAARDLQTL